MLLTQDEINKYRLWHRKSYVAICDQCKRLIPADALYVVDDWKKRKDKLTFLGSIAANVMCMECNGLRTGVLKMVDHLVIAPKIKPQKLDKHDNPYLIARLINRLFKRQPTDVGYDTNEIIMKLYRRAANRTYKKSEIRRTLREMKQVAMLKKKSGKWLLRASKKSK